MSNTASHLQVTDLQEANVERMFEDNTPSTREALRKARICRMQKFYREVRIRTLDLLDEVGEALINERLSKIKYGLL